MSRDRDLRLQSALNEVRSISENPDLEDLKRVLSTCVNGENAEFVAEEAKRFLFPAIRRIRHIAVALDDLSWRIPIAGLFTLIYKLSELGKLSHDEAVEYVSCCSSRNHELSGMVIRSVFDERLCQLFPVAEPFLHQICFGEDADQPPRTKCRFSPRGLAFLACISSGPQAQIAVLTAESAYRDLKDTLHEMNSQMCDRIFKEALDWHLQCLSEFEDLRENMGSPH